MTHTDTITLRSAARSSTGLVRKNNQDSGYAGASFLLVADGMGGHAGGDVASAITVARLSDLDTPDQGSDALDVLRSSILDANQRITNCVIEKPELAGMGTTVTALLRTGDRLALAHIGDSRAYLMRERELSLVTHDHTFVQMLVDEGRITEEEAETHPQRSVVMRVLGDVGSAPELDLSIRDTRPGDRWMLCSDGLTGFASIDDIGHALRTIPDPAACCDRLVDLALAGGGADNVTVVIGDVIAVEEPGAAVAAEGLSVGSVRINPQYAELGRASVPTELIPTGPLDIVDLPHTAPTAVLQSTAAGLQDTQPLPSAPGGLTAADRRDAASPKGADRSGSGSSTDSAGTAGATEAAGAPDADSASQRTATGASAGESGAGAAQADSLTDDDFSGWGADEVPPRRRRPVLGLIISLLVIAAVAATGIMGWNFVRGQYYVGIDSGNVAVYRGIAQTLGPIELSSLEESTDIDIDLLSTHHQNRLEQTIPADSREAADAVVQMLREEAEANTGPIMRAGASDADEEDPAPADPTDVPSPDASAGISAPSAGDR